MSAYEKDRRGKWVRIRGDKPPPQLDDLAQGLDEVLVDWCAGLSEKRRMALIYDLHYEGRVRSRQSLTGRSTLGEAESLDAPIHSEHKARRLPSPLRPPESEKTGRHRQRAVLRALDTEDWRWLLTRLTAQHLEMHRLMSVTFEQLEDAEQARDWERVQQQLAEDQDFRALMREHLRFWRSRRLIPPAWNPAKVREDMVRYITENTTVST